MHITLDSSFDNSSLFKFMKRVDYLTYLAEMDSKRFAVAMGFDLHISLDVDEYVAPSHNITVLDELDFWFSHTKRKMMFSRATQLHAN